MLGSWTEQYCTSAKVLLTLSNGPRLKKNFVTAITFPGSLSNFPGSPFFESRSHWSEKVNFVECYLPRREEPRSEDQAASGHEQSARVGTRNRPL